MERAPNRALGGRWAHCIFGSGDAKADSVRNQAVDRIPISSD